MGKTRENNNAVESDDRLEALKLKNQICCPLYACAKEIVRRYKPYLDKIDLTYTQYIVMMVLWEKEACTVKELGECLFLDSGTLTPLLKKLEAKGYITRHRSDEDERNLIIHITETGMNLREEAVLIPQAMSQCIELEPEEAMRFYNTLYKLLGSITR